MSNYITKDGAAAPPTSLSFPNVYQPDKVRTEYSLEVYLNGSYVKSCVHHIRTDTANPARFESCSKVNRDGRTGSYVSEFSKKARRAMLQEFSKINSDLIFADDQDAHLLTFTLSYFEKNPDWIKVAWKNFRDSFQRKYPKSCGIFRWHFTPGVRNAPHIHMVAFGLDKMPKGSKEKQEFCAWACDTWYRCLYQDNPEITSEYPNHKNAVDVEAAYSVKGIMDYVSAYSSSDRSHTPSWWKRSHHWGYYNRLAVKELQTKEVIALDEEGHEKSQQFVVGEINKKIIKSAQLKDRIIVTNLSKLATEDDLKAIFEPFGAVHKVDIKKLRSGMSMGYAFVNMLSHDSAELATKSLDGFELLGSTLKVKYSATFLVQTFDAVVNESPYTKPRRDPKEYDSPYIVDSFYGRKVVREVHHPIAEGEVGWLVEDELDLVNDNSFVLVNDDYEIIRTGIKTSDCRFMKGSNSSKSIGVSFYDSSVKPEVKDLVEDVRTARIAKHKKKFKEWRKEKREEAAHLGMTFEELISEFGYGTSEFDPYGYGFHKRVEDDAHGTAATAAVGLSHGPNLSMQEEMEVTKNELVI